MKITTKDGKLFYALRTGKLLTINSDHAVLARSVVKILKDTENVNEEENWRSCPVATPCHTSDEGI